MIIEEKKEFINESEEITISVNNIIGENMMVNTHYYKHKLEQIERRKIYLIHNKRRIIP